MKQTSQMSQMSQLSEHAYRVGWIHYTNAAPILDALELPEEVQVLQGVPTEMNTALLERRVDMANISAVEFVRHADRLAALSDFSISVLGPVYSVCLFHRLPLEQLQRIAFTSQSAMSVCLLELCLRQRGLSPALICAEGPAEDLLQQGFDAVLRIGDSALREWYQVAGPLTADRTMTTLLRNSATRAGTRADGRHGLLVTDLAQEWFDLTGYPFVFAVWAYHKDRPPPKQLVEAMRVARRYGLGHLAALAERHAPRLQLPVRVVQHYLWNFRYHLEVPDKLGLQAFARQAVPDHEDLCFRDVF